MFLASSEFLGSSPHTLLGFFLGSSLQGGVLCILFFLFFCSSIVHLISMAQYLITATALELVFFTTLPEFWLLNFDFWVFFILQKYSFPTFSFISKFLNLSALYPSVYILLHLQYFLWLHYLVAIYLPFSMQYLLSLLVLQTYLSRILFSCLL